MSRHTHFHSPKGICFDVGNVLIFPDGKVISEAFNELFKIDVSPVTCIRAFFLSDRDEYLMAKRSVMEIFEFVKNWSRHLGVTYEQGRTVWNYLSDKYEHRYWTVLNPEAKPLLNKLSDMGIALSVVSNTDGMLVKDLTTHGIVGFFDAIIDSVVVKMTKPDPEIYQLGVQEMGMLPDECWYVGDEVIEIQGALRAGLKNSILYDPQNIHSDIQFCKRIVDLREIVQLIDQLN